MDDSGHNEPPPSDGQPPNQAVPTLANPKQRLEQLIRDDQLNELKNLLERREDLLEISLPYKFAEDGKDVVLDVTPLALAAALDRTSIVEDLLGRGAKVDAVGSDPGKTALHLAARFSTKDTIKLLLSRNAGIDAQDEKGSSPLHLACQYGRVEMLDGLMNAHATLSCSDKEGRTPFLIACMYGQEAILRRLLSGGRDQMSHVDRKSNGPLHLACLEKNQGAVEWLLKSGVDVDQPRTDKKTPLFQACRGGNVKIIETLIEYGADIHRRDVFGDSPILYSCWRLQRKSLETLLSHGASASDVNTLGNTCFHESIRNKRASDGDIGGMLRTLSDANVDVNQVNGRGESALSVACTSQKHELVKRLIGLGANIDQRQGSDGSTVLMDACRESDMPLVRILLQEGADTMVRDRDGHTALYAAVIKDKIEVALELLMARCNSLENQAGTGRTFKEQIGDIITIEKSLLEYSKKVVYDGQERVIALLHWAISNDAVELVDHCMSRHADARRWEQKGTTWLHVTANNGSILAAQRLLKMIPEPSERVGAIIKQNDRGESPLAISIDRRYSLLEAIFWDAIAQLRKDRSFIPLSRPRDLEKADEIIEVVAMYEAPGNEPLLRKLLKGWYPITEGEAGQDEIALHMAVRRSRAVVVWWLLSKGGYSGPIIEDAQRLVSAKYGNVDVGNLIRDLLRNPPPILPRVSNLKKDLVTVPPVLTGEGDSALNTRGNIVDIRSNSEGMNISSRNFKISEIIYEKGPESLMKGVEGSLDQRDLKTLKERLGNPSPIACQQEGNSSDESLSKQGVHLAGAEPISQGEHSNGDLELRWVHLPVNDLQLMRDLVRRLSHDSERLAVDYRSLMTHLDQSWTELAAGGKRRYMKPRCVIKYMSHRNRSNHDLDGSQLSEEPTTCIAVYMPYITLGNHPSKEVNGDTGRPHGPGNLMKSRNSRQIKHKPITLDQYYYPSIVDTGPRDADQVLSKFLRRRDPSDTRIFMVNQLWLWIVDEKTVITATEEDSITPEEAIKAEDSDEMPARNLFQTTLIDIIRGEARSRLDRGASVWSMMELILGVATQSFTDKWISFLASDKSTKVKEGPIDIFRESIRDVAESETRLFRNFLAGLRGGTDERGERHHKVREAEFNRYHVISNETELLDQTRDIHDELNILKSVAEHQEAVWKQAFPPEMPAGHLPYYHSCPPTDVTNDLDGMLSEAVLAKDYINTLLELRLAEYSRAQASSAFIFTVVATVFLPLSFLVSLFALNISIFPHEEGNVVYEAWWLLPIIFGATIAVSVPTIIFAWNINTIPKWARSLWSHVSKWARSLQPYIPEWVLSLLQRLQELRRKRNQKTLPR